MTRAEALALAREKWGEVAFARPFRGNLVEVGHGNIGWIGSTYQAACRAAGLIV